MVGLFFEGYSHKQSGATLYASKGSIYVAMCGTRTLLVLPAKQGLKWKLSENVACIVSLKNRCHYESVPNLVKMDFPIHVLVFSFHFEVTPCSLISHDY